MAAFGLDLLAKGIEQTAQFGFDQANNAIAYSRSKKLMALQNQYAVENWRRANAYNTPAMQMARLKAAGLNPDLMYGNGAAGLQGADIGNPSLGSTPNVSNPTSSLASLMQANTERDLADSQVSLNKALAEKASADAGKANAETVLLGTEADFRADFLKSQIDRNNMDVQVGNSVIRLNTSKSNLNDAEIDKVYKEIDLYDKQMKEADARIRNIDADTALKKIDQAFKGRMYEAQISQLMSLANLNRTQAQDLVATQFSRIQATNAAAGRDAAQMNNLDASTNLMEFDLENTKDLDVALKKLGVGTAAIKLIMQILKATD